MTQLEFEAYVRIYPRRLNIWYSETAPYTILGISIPTYTAPPNSQDISNYIETLTKITLPLTTGGSVKLTILSKIRQTVPDSTQSDGGSTYYLCTVSPTEIPLPTTILTTGEVGFSPLILKGEFTNGDYDVLLGNVQQSRTSEYIMESDRFKVGTLENPSYTGPVNIELLLTSSATKANVQDSLYSNTGWTNARYNGSTTNEFNYGATPAESGIVFKGAFYPRGVSVDQIRYQVSGSQAIYEDYFYSGRGTTAGFNSTPTKFLLTGSFGKPFHSDYYYAFDQELYFKVSLQGLQTPPPPIKPGSIITIGTSTVKGTELIKVVATSAPIVYSTYALYYVLTQRLYLANEFIYTSYNNYLATTSNTPDPLFAEITAESKLYRAIGNKLQPVPEGRLVVKESGAILRLDPYGVVVQTL